MSVLTVTYKGSTIAELTSSASKTFYTSSKYCEDDIVLNYNISSDEEDAFINRTISTCTNNDVTTIGYSAFASCTKLTTASFPNCITIDYSAFERCSSLTSISFPKCTFISDAAFLRCSGLTTASFPECTYIRNSAFYSCTKLTTISFPKCTSIGGYTFLGCSGLTTVSFPKCTSIGGYAFSDCSGLTTASFPVCATVAGSAFRSCLRLKSFYLTNSSVATLNNSSAFYSTPIGGYSTTAGTFGSIYVPARLLASYKAATNWTYFSSRFVGI